MRMRTIRPWTLSSALLFTPVLVLAAQVNLLADHISYHDKTHTSTYQNNVKVTYGQSHFIGQEMIVKHGNTQLPNALIITGKPVKFTIEKAQKGKQTSMRVTGKASKIILQPHQNKIILAGNAIVINGIEMLTGETIVYHLGRIKKT